MYGWLRWSLAFVSVVITCALVVSCTDPIGEARELEKAGDWYAALGVYERLLESDPGDVSALSGAAVALMVLHRYDEAIAYQEAVIAADPNDAQTRVELGFNYLNHQGRADDAARVMSEAAAIEPTAKNFTFLAQAQKGANDLDGAERSLRMAIEVDPAYGYAYSQLAGLLEEQGRPGEAAALLRDARAAGVDVGESQ